MKNNFEDLLPGDVFHYEFEYNYNNEIHSSIAKVIVIDDKRIYYKNIKIINSSEFANWHDEVMSMRINSDNHKFVKYLFTEEQTLDKLNRLYPEYFL